MSMTQRSVPLILATHADIQNDAPCPCCRVDAGGIGLDIINTYVLENENMRKYNCVVINNIGS